ncbi:MAG: type II secretion system protein [Candidatus Izemoplasmatales bacterium]|nr:type II secretion system protein [Candidatus Izemoplasmatales bacterium]
MKKISFVSNVLIGRLSSRNVMRFRFTLIELLSVIGIIAMLAAMLLPALKKTQEKARQIQCSNNLKQVSLAISMYVGDYDGYIPWCEMTGDWHNWWPYPINSYLTSKTIGFAKGGSPSLVCPSGPDELDAYFKMNYAYNIQYGWVSAGTVVCLPRKFSSFRNPGDSTIIVDGANKTSKIVDKYDCIQSGGPGPDYRHRGGLSVLWVDAHVDWRRYGELNTQQWRGH